MRLLLQSTLDGVAIRDLGKIKAITYLRSGTKRTATDGSIDLVLGFDCILRRLDAENRQISHQVDKLYQKYGLVGFHTYGEQFNAMHLNQTLTGIAFGRREEPS